jgi:hypothetical protein
MKFSTSDAAFEGFRLTRAHPKAVALWALVSIPFNLAMTGVLVSLSGPALTEMRELSQAGPAADPTAVFDLLGEIMRGYVVMIPLGLIFVSILINAVYRASSRPTANVFGFLRLGAAELRQLVALLVIGLLGVIYTIVTSFVLSIVATVASFAAGGPQSPIGLLVMMCILYAGLFALWLPFYVKFSFSGPMTFVQNRICIFSSWGATAGHFWPLAGCYVLAGVAGIVVTLLGMAIGAAVLVSLGGDLGQMMRPDMSSLSTYLTPGMIGYLIVGAFFNTLTYAIYFGPAMAAYKAIHGGSAEASQAFE